MVVSVALMCTAYALRNPCFETSWIAVWLDVNGDVLQLAMIDLDQRINLALMDDRGELKVQ